MPIDLQEEDGACGPYNTRFMRRLGVYSPRSGNRWGGTWEGLSGRTRAYWGSVRAAERAALARGEEPEPARTRRSAKWRYL